MEELKNTRDIIDMEHREGHKEIRLEHKRRVNGISKNTTLWMNVNKEEGTSYKVKTGLETSVLGIIKAL